MSWWRKLLEKLNIVKKKESIKTKESADVVEESVNDTEDDKEDITENTVEEDKDSEIVPEIVDENTTPVTNLNMEQLLSLCESDIEYIKNNAILDKLFTNIVDFSIKNEYTIFSDNTYNYNINLWFIRNSSVTEDAFNDVVFVFYKESITNIWKGKLFRLTTNPGLYYLNNPAHKDGTAIIAPGQYIGTHKIDIHRRNTSSAHEALCHRRGIVKVFRDNNMDSVLDISGSIYLNGAGLNCHQPTVYSENTGKVNRSSAGCLVHRTRKQFDSKQDLKTENTFMGLLRLSVDNWGEWVSITLIESNKLM